MRTSKVMSLEEAIRKSGLKGGWAAVPVAREYQLARCAGREAEGRVYSIVTLCSILLNLVMLILNYTPEAAGSVSSQDLIISVLVLSLALINYIYLIRIVLGLIEVYGLKKRWILLWLSSVTMWIPSLIWGFQKKYQPACIFCGSSDGIQKIHGKNVCANCIKELQEL